MRRREFIGFVTAALAWPVSARAQQADKTPRVAFLGTERTTPPQSGYYQAFSAQLEKNGFREGQNIVIEYRSTDDPRGPFVGAAELLRSQPDWPGSNSASGRGRERPYSDRHVRRQL